ncbi:MAG: SGNH/GDSL hydrolase family protein [Bacteroidetes bacterium]|nr:MAG: SGNH/GDSL hydrolase family protein [Bacteroidota bacterium]
MLKKTSFFKIFLVSLITIEIIGGAVLVWKFSTSRAWVLGAQAQIVPLEKKNFQFPQDSTLQYYYEPQPSTNETDDFDWLSYKPTYTINKDGLNERFDYTVDKPSDVYRIITLGDSFTFGLYVNTAENWPENLEDLLNSNLQCKNIKKFEVINLGVPGYDIEYSAERYKRRGVKYNPDLVIWFINDDLGQISEKMAPLNDECFAKISTNEDKYEGVKRCWGETYEKVKADLGNDDGFRKYINNALLNINKYYSGRLLMIIDGKASNDDKELIRNFADNRENAYLYDNLIDYKKIGGIFPDGHPKAEAYTYIAKDVFDYLVKNKNIQCES